MFHLRFYICTSVLATIIAVYLSTRLKCVYLSMYIKMLLILRLRDDYRYYRSCEEKSHDVSSLLILNWYDSSEYARINSIKRDTIVRMLDMFRISYDRDRDNYMYQTEFPVRKMSSLLRTLFSCISLLVPLLTILIITLVYRNLGII